MNGLKHLAGLLNKAPPAAIMPMSDCPAMDKLLEELTIHVKATSRPLQDHLRQAVIEFSESGTIGGFRKAYLVSWGVSMPYGDNGPCILENPDLFEKLIDFIESYVEETRRYRRCYQGLMSGYFAYDGMAEDKPEDGRDNWRRLRDYLLENVNRIRHDATKINPGWVDEVTAGTNRQIFTERPCRPYIDLLLETATAPESETSRLERLCSTLGIDQTSWFRREIVVETVRSGTEHTDPDFLECLPRLLQLLENNAVFRDWGLALLLNRYAEINGTPLNTRLRDKSVEWWGNPWLPSARLNWGRVRPETRKMVADWLKSEYIDIFFTKLAEDGADERRVKFWKNYIASIRHIEFALGSYARDRRNKDMEVLRKKLTGLIKFLDASGNTNAFIMHLGPLVVVEFSDIGALYLYRRERVPFDSRKPLRLRRDDPNTLKNPQFCEPKLVHHHDWEVEFSKKLDRFGIRPDNSTQTVRKAHNPGDGMARENVRISPDSDSGFSSVMRFCELNRLKIEDRRDLGGHFWVRTDDRHIGISRALRHFGFQYMPYKGWWRK
jgi:hypothetical protein